jgi:hypothetical protein
MLRTVFSKVRGRRGVALNVFCPKRCFRASFVKSDSGHANGRAKWADCNEDKSGGGCTEDHVIYVNENYLKYGYLPGMFCLAQFLIAVQGGAYLVYNAKPAEVTELMCAVGSTSVMTGVVLYGVASWGKSFVVEIRAPESQEYVELTTLGLLGVNIQKISTVDFLDCSSDTLSTHFLSPGPSLVGLGLRSGAFFGVDIKKGTVHDMPWILKASRGRL